MCVCRYMQLNKFAATIESVFLCVVKRETLRRMKRVLRVALVDIPMNGFLGGFFLNGY